ncbi:MAG TPA: hypothetical protein VI685_12520 [Candidatus Angelobacter sp.]
MGDKTTISVGVNYVFSHSYEVKVLESYALVHPAEKLHQYPSVLEEGDRSGLYLRVAQQGFATWIGFFAQGFDSTEVAHGVFSCPDPDWLCVVASGYAYLVDSTNPQHWIQVEQRPVAEVRTVPELKLLLFTGFTSITALGESQKLWTTERLSWEGIYVTDIHGSCLRGTGWDAIADKEVAFEVDLLTGKSEGGARPGS